MLFPFRTYCLDTSFLIYLEMNFKPDNPVFSAIWKELDDLISQGCLMTSTFVQEEIEAYQGKETYLKKWLKKRKQIIRQMDAPSLILAQKVINEHQNTGFLKPKKWEANKNEADPYLIGLCKTHSWVLLTRESDDRVNRLPMVARSYGVEVLPFVQFLEERKLKMVKVE
jgi:hypothetical protein